MNYPSLLLSLYNCYLCICHFLIFFYLCVWSKKIVKMMLFICSVATHNAVLVISQWWWVTDATQKNDSLSFQWVSESKSNSTYFRYISQQQSARGACLLRVLLTVLFLPILFPSFMTSSNVFWLDLPWHHHDVNDRN